MMYSTRTRRLPREDPRTKVGEEVDVGVRVGPVEFKFYEPDTRDLLRKSSRENPRDDVATRKRVPWNSSSTTYVRRGQRAPCAFIRAACDRAVWCCCRWWLIHARSSSKHRFCHNASLPPSDVACERKTEHESSTSRFGDDDEYSFRFASPKHELFDRIYGIIFDGYSNFDLLLSLLFTYTSYNTNYRVGGLCLQFRLQFGESPK